MKSIIPYLFFDGNCRKAMEFYKVVFGGDLSIMTYGDAPGAPCPAAAKNRVMHGMLKNGEFTLYSSDTPEEAPEKGNTIHLAMACNSLEHLEEVFKKLSENGKVFQPPHDAFWGDRFAMLTDQFGFSWMLMFTPKKV